MIRRLRVEGNDPPRFRTQRGFAGLTPAGSAERMLDTASGRAGDFVAARTRAGVDVFVLPTRKFKTKLVRVHWRTPSSRRNAARALVPNLMRRGTRRHPTMSAVSRAFESLYGSSWSSSVYKHGQEQITSLRLETVEERFLPGKPPIFAPAVALMRELLFEPNLVRGAFPDDVFEQEKLNHRRDIEAQYNDKMTWAFQRLLDETFGDEPYGLPVLGTVADANALKGGDAVAAWTDLKDSLPARVFAVGDFDPVDVQAIADELFAAVRPAAAPVPRTARAPAAAGAAPKVLVERDDVSQSKLITARMVDLENLDEREFDALRVYAGILGGGFHSRMFQTIREKNSLAYFASASLDRLRGVLFTSCGIDAADRDQVGELTEGEIVSLRAAPPRDPELEQTRRLMISGARGMFDSAGGMVETLEAGLSAGRVRTLDAICRSLAAVTAADVQRVARRIGPVLTIYCLEGAAHHGEDA
jgi:predicted Zn-dependent peptidase